MRALILVLCFAAAAALAQTYPPGFPSAPSGSSASLGYQWIDAGVQTFDWITPDTVTKSIWLGPVRAAPSDSFADSRIMMNGTAKISWNSSNGGVMQAIYGGSEMNFTQFGVADPLFQFTNNGSLNSGRIHVNAIQLVGFNKDVLTIPQSTGRIVWGANGMAFVATAPTIASGFGTSPSITGNPMAFRVTIGSAPGTAGEVTLSASSVGWNCMCDVLGSEPTNWCHQVSSTTTSATFESVDENGALKAWGAAQVVKFICTQF